MLVEMDFYPKAALDVFQKLYYEDHEIVFVEVGYEKDERDVIREIEDVINDHED